MQKSSVLANWPVSQQSIEQFDVVDFDGSVRAPAATFRKTTTYEFVGLGGIPTTQQSFMSMTPMLSIPFSELGIAESGNAEFKMFLSKHETMGNIFLIKMHMIRLNTKFSVIQDNVTTPGVDGADATITQTSLIVPNYTSGVGLAPVWTMPEASDYDFWLLSKCPYTDRGQAHFFAAKKSNKMTIGRPPLPNCFGDTRFCIGNEEWCRRGASDPIEVAKAAVKAAFINQWQTDLLTEQAKEVSKRIFRFDIETQKQVPTVPNFATDCGAVAHQAISNIMSMVVE
jgi:hypothetical protein